jgi:uncharacterized protein YqiB (DUF1249 family)
MRCRESWAIVPPIVDSAENFVNVIFEIKHRLDVSEGVHQTLTLSVGTTLMHISPTPSILFR